VTVKKLYEARDGSINVSAEFRLSRFLFGFAYTEAPFTNEVRMRMLALHLWCVCVTFTRFFLRDATPAEIRKEMERRGRAVGIKPKGGSKRR
jgi:hypothetical protein